MSKIRTPALVVDALALREGDEFDVCVAGARVFDTPHDRDRELALARIRGFQKALPPNWKFDRDEANAR